MPGNAGMVAALTQAKIPPNALHAKSSSLIFSLTVVIIIKSSVKDMIGYNDHHMIYIYIYIYRTFKYEHAAIPGEFLTA